MYEYKVICTTATGVPLKGKPTDSYQKQLELGLNELGKAGWGLVSMYGCYMVFSRLKRTR